MGVMAVADNFAVNIPNPKCAADQSRIPVMQRCHAVIHMGHGRRTIGSAHQSLFVGCRRMTHADHHAVLGTVTGQRMIRIMFRTQGDIFNPSSGRRLILLKLFHRWLGDGFRRLGSLIFHIQIRTFKMNT